MQDHDDVMYTASKIGSQLRAEMLKAPDLTDTFTELDVATVGELTEIQFTEVMQMLSLHLGMSMKQSWSNPRTVKRIFQKIAILREEAECMITFMIAVSLPVMTPNLDVTEDVRDTALEWVHRLRRHTEPVDKLQLQTAQEYPWDILKKDQWGRSLHVVEALNPHDWWIKKQDSAASISK